MSAAATSTQAETEQPREQHGSTLLLVAGIVSRTWLWFVAGCLAVTLLPMLIGWRPYVVQSGSMLPRIHVGDVILAAPASSGAELLGRVTVFTDPANPDEVKSHRVVAVNPDGTLTTKGDANPTADSTPVPFSDVRGLGRLLVTFVGLPFIWAKTGQWLLVALFVLSLLVAASIVSRDQEPDDDEDEDDESDDTPVGGDPVPLPLPSSGRGSSTIAASSPLDPGLSRAGAPHVTDRRGSRAGRLVRRTAYVALLAAVLAVPGVGASFAATTTSPANSWSVGSWRYSAMVTGLNPWLYWRLDDTTGSIAADSSTNGRTGSYWPDASATSFTRGVTGAMTSSTPNRAVTLASGSCLVTTSASATPAPPQLTEIVWFKTTTTAGGKLLGFESPRTGVLAAASGGAYDRQLYLDAAGQVWFGIGTTTLVGIRSAAGLNDGRWHMAAATLSSTAGMALFIDGVQVATSPATAAGAYSGWWRAGCGNISGWVSFWDGGGSPSASKNQARDLPFAGSLDEVTVWQSALTPAQIAGLYSSR